MSDILNEMLTEIRNEYEPLLELCKEAPTHARIERLEELRRRSEWAVRMKIEQESNALWTEFIKEIRKSIHVR